MGGVNEERVTDQVIALLLKQMRIELEVDVAGNRGDYKRQLRVALWLGNVQIDWDEVELGEMQ